MWDAIAPYYDEDDVLRFLRHKRRGLSDEERAWLDAGRKAVRETAVFYHTERAFRFRVRRGEGVLLTQDGTAVHELPYRSLLRLFADGITVYVCCCTIGHEVYRSIRRCFAVDPAAAVVMDATASVTVDAYAAYLQHSFGATTMRFSPGYGDVPLVENRALARLVRADRIGVRLTEGNLMVPEKSIIFLTGKQERRSG